MARVCERCGAGPSSQAKRKLLRGKYNPTPKRMKYPNLQWVRLPAQAGLSSGKRVKFCAKCIKTLNKVRSI